jgi:site-specific DNA recombinase
MTRRQQQPVKRLLSGLLRCGVCEAGMSKKDVDHSRPRIICSRMKEAATCGNRRVHYVDEIERIVVDGLRAELGTRDAVAYYVECYNAERRRLAAGDIAARGTLENQLADIERKIDRAVKAVIDGQITREEADRYLPALRAQRAQLAARLVTIRKAAGRRHPAVTLVNANLNDLARLEDVVNRDLAVGDDGAAKAIRALVDTVTVIPTPAGMTPGIVVPGRLNSLLGRDPFADGSHVGGPDGAG